MNEKLAEALGHISDRHIAQAAAQRKKRHVLPKAIAAILVLALLVNLPPIQLWVTADAVSLSGKYQEPERPDRDNYDSYEAFRRALDAYNAAQSARSGAVYAANESLFNFYKDSFQVFLEGDSNAAWSPVNAYVALAMLAETTGSTTQAEILDVLGVDSVETLRSQAGSVWESIYETDGKEISVLANSLWLDEHISYHQEVMDTLARSYYADVYRDHLGSSSGNRAIRTWINNQTGGFLNDMVPAVDLAPSGDSIATVMAIVSTIYFQSKWREAFDGSLTQAGPFHSPAGDVSVQYMRTKEEAMTYHWGESYGAVALYLKNGSIMWLILPDEDKNLADVLAEGEYLSAVTCPEPYNAPNSTEVKVNLSLPKFDLSSSLDLKEGLQKLGIREAFDIHGGDFSPALDSQLPIFINQISQSTRVAIDEEGVTAASYIELEFGAGAAMPPEEIMDFILDRPFLFVISSDEGIPLFAGVVNEP